MLVFDKSDVKATIESCRQAKENEKRKNLSSMFHNIIRDFKLAGENRKLAPVPSYVIMRHTSHSLFVWPYLRLLTCPTVILMIKYARF